MAVTSLLGLHFTILSPLASHDRVGQKGAIFPMRLIFHWIVRNNIIDAVEPVRFDPPRIGAANAGLRLAACGGVNL